MEEDRGRSGLGTGHATVDGCRTTEDERTKRQMANRKWTHETVDGKKFQTLEAAIQHAAKLLGSLPEYVWSCGSKQPVYVLYPNHTQESLR